MILKLVLFTLAIFITCIFLISLWGFYTVLHPPKVFSTNTPKDYNIDYEQLSFKTKDNIVLHGWFVPAKNKSAPTIILLHGYGADMGDLLPTRVFLHQYFNLFFFDFRYFGKSSGTYSTVGLNEIEDLTAAIQFLSARGIHEVGVWGLSMGGAVALMTAVHQPAIKALVVESSYARLDMMASRYFEIPLLRYPLAMLLRLWAYVFLGHDVKAAAPVEAAARLQIPILLIYSEGDLFISPEHGVLIKNAISKNTRADIWVFKTAPHAAVEEGYQEKIATFFLKYLQ